jgi:hypothetical protein
MAHADPENEIIVRLSGSSGGAQFSMFCGPDYWHLGTNSGGSAELLGNRSLTAGTKQLFINFCDLI